MCEELSNWFKFKGHKCNLSFSLNYCTIIYNVIVIITVCRHSQPFLSVSGNVYPKHGRRSASVNRWCRIQRVSSIWSARRKYISRYENPPDSPPPGRSSYCDADLGTCRVQVILSSHWSAWGNTELWLVQGGRSLRPSSSLASLRAPRSDDWSVSSTRSVGILDTLMCRLNMPGPMNLFCILFITLFTSIHDAFMFRLNMSSQISLLRKLFHTVITTILQTFMYRKNMCFQIILLCCLIVTLVTSILDTFMFRLNVSC